MKHLTSSVYTFENLIRGNFLYVDKTEYIWRLIAPASEMYFLSRPRRFGKSLTISTLKAVFEGKRELFEGLAISKKNYDWKPYPILLLSFGDYNPNCNTPEKLNLYLLDKVSDMAKAVSVELSTADNPSIAFGRLIDTLAGPKGQVVILIDEYDKPILDNINSPNLQDLQRCLKGFYSVLKDRNSKERFLFVTGVSKFSHVSIFSDLNNLTDITKDARYATMLGYTQEELERNFGEYFRAIAGEKDFPSLMAKVKDWYDGFRFHENAETVYNPVSVARFIESGGEFNNYWFATGTPSFLLDLVRKKNFDFERVLGQPVSELAFSAYDVDNLEVLPLLLQTGYLTIKDAFQKFGTTFYNLRFPNHEVRSAFENYLLNAYTGIEKDSLTGYMVNFAESVESGRAEAFIECLTAFLAAIPYDFQIRDEKYYQTVFYSLFLLLGVFIKAEARTNKGRIDAVAACGDWLYLFEFKLDKDADAALAQIVQKEYYQKYNRPGRKVILVGVNFDFAKRQISDWTQRKLASVP